MAEANPALEQFLKGIPLFSLVEAKEMMDILRLLRPVELEPGHALFKEGDPGRAMWILSAGCEVSISTTPTGSKRPIAVAYAREGEVVGEMALVDDGPRSGTAVVVNGGHAHEIQASDFHALRDAFNPAAFKVLRRICIDLCRRLRATNERIVPSGHQNIETPALPKGPRASSELLDRFPPFKPLPALVKLALAQKLHVIDVHGVTPLFAEGEPSDGIYFVVEGEVSVGRNGKTLANLVPGTMFGLVSAIDSGARSASCLTTGPAKLLKLEDQDFDALFASGHRFAFQIVDLVARQLVGHLRAANSMIPLPGKPAGKAGEAKPMDLALKNPKPDEDGMPPLELEIDIEESLSSAGDLLG